MKASALRRFHFLPTLASNVRVDFALEEVKGTDHSSFTIKTTFLYTPRSIDELKEHVSFYFI